jgi:hypothetical protein
MQTTRRISALGGMKNLGGLPGGASSVASGINRWIFQSGLCADGIIAPPHFLEFYSSLADCIISV